MACKRAGEGEALQLTSVNHGLRQNKVWLLITFYLSVVQYLYTYQWYSRGVAKGGGGGGGGVPGVTI